MHSAIGGSLGTNGPWPTISAGGLTTLMVAKVVPGSLLKPWGDGKPVFCLGCLGVNKSEV